MRAFVCSLILVSSAAFAMEVHAQGGSITGRVTDEGTGAPLGSVQIYIEALDIGSLSQPNGNYLLLNVPAGTHALTAQRIGYATVSQQVSIAAGATVVDNFALGQTVLSLDEIVVTGAGQATERRRLGNVVSSVGGAEIQALAPTTTLDVLRTQVPGLIMYSGTSDANGGGAIRLRGISSMALNNEPVLYIDGVRVDNQPPRAIGTGGGRTQSRLSEINPDDIERIEILRGAAAATLYGSEASAGVIQVFTKRGQLGAPSFTVRTSGRAFMLPQTWAPNAAYMPETGQIITTDPLGDWSQTGWGADVYLSASGGTGDFTYFISGDLDRERSFWVAHDVQYSGGLSANLGLELNDKARIQTNFMWNRVANDYPAAIIEGPDYGFSSLLSDPRLVGVGGRPWGEFAWRRTHDIGVANSQYNRNVDRLLMSSRLQYDFSTNITGQVQVGMETTTDANTEWWAPFDPTLDPNGRGDREIRRANARVATLDASLAWEASLGSRFTFSTVGGVQAFQDKRDSFASFVRLFPPGGVELIQAGSDIRSVTEAYVEETTGGVFLQEQIGIDDNLFITFGGRVDGSSTFGDDLGLQFYPKAALAYGVPESVLPGFISQMRPRFAVGQSGNQPDAFDSDRTWVPQVRLDNQNVFAPGKPGNPDLGPERMTEYESGFDMAFLDGRVGFEVTAFHQTVRNALIPVQAAPSSGFTSPQLTNLGEMVTKGIEIGADVVLWNSGDRRWTLNGSLATLDSKVTDLGDVGTVTFTSDRHIQLLKEGFQPFSFFGTMLDESNPYTLSVDAANLTEFGQITPNKIKNSAGADSVGVLGGVLPSWTATMGSSLTLGALTVSALVEGAGGFSMWHEDRMLQCRASGALCMEQALVEQELDNPATTTERRIELADQSAHQHVRVNSNQVHSADYIRIEQVSLAWRLPGGVLNAIGFNEANSITLQGTVRNLAMWTEWIGDRGDPLASRYSLEDNGRQLFDLGSSRALFPRRRDFSLEVRATF
jgi:TonB-dependent SusC/RagA subfamily outer membrane receptor